MGRAFEYRKATKLKRWGHMAKTFTRLGKQIAIAVKAGGPDPDMNPALRSVIAVCKRENMPKDNIDRAIKNAQGKDQSNYETRTYEGYGPHGIAVLVEAATDNNNRTVANVRSYFTKAGGSLGTAGSVEYMFDRKSMFRFKSTKPYDLEELELELIDYGVDEIFEEEDEDENKEIVVYGEFTAFNQIQEYIEDNGFELISGEFTRLPNTDLKDLDPESRAKIEKLIDNIEEDEDVQNVYTNLKPAE